MTPAASRLSARPWLGAAAAYVVLTFIVTYPLALAGGRVVSAPLDDPLLNVWILWWNTHAIPLTDAWWNAPIFHPARGAMAFSELLLGLLPITAPVQWIFHNPVLAYNAAVLASYPLCALAAHALGLELTGRHDAAWLAGLAFGFSPYRGSQIGHVQVLSYYAAPLALLALHRYARTGRWRWAAAFSAAFLLQVLCNGYALFHLPVLIALWVAWFARRRRDLLAIGIAAACALLLLAPILLRYHAIHTHYRFARSISDIRTFSADLSTLVAPPGEAVLLGGLVRPYSGYGLFPGATVAAFLLVAAGLHAWRRPRSADPRGLDRLVLASIAVLALIAAGSALAFGPWAFAGIRVTQPFKPFTIAVLALLLYGSRGTAWRQSWRSRSSTAFYAMSMVVCYVLALGPEPRLLGYRIVYKAPYAWLMALPGFDSTRTPSRFAWLGLLCLAALVALVYDRCRALRPDRARLLWSVLAVGIVADGMAVSRFQAVPPPGPSGDWSGASAILELPLQPSTDALAIYRSMRYGRPIVNGTSGYYPPHYWALTHALQSGDLGVVNELTTGDVLGIAVDRTSPGHAALEAAVSAFPGVAPLGSSEAWATFRVRPLPRAAIRTGPRLALREVRATVGAEDVWRMHDGRVETSWSSVASGPQAGGEAIEVRLETPHAVGAVVLRMGSCPFGFPRELAVDTSPDGQAWTEAWRGPTAVATVRAALNDPSDVPLTVPIPGVTAEFIRLRQTGRDPDVPWCVSELSIHQPH